MSPQQLARCRGVIYWHAQKWNIYHQAALGWETWSIIMPSGVQIRTVKRGIVAMLVQDIKHKNILISFFKPSMKWADVNTEMGVYLPPEIRGIQKYIPPCTVRLSPPFTSCGGAFQLHSLLWIFSINFPWKPGHYLCRSPTRVLSRWTFKTPGIPLQGWDICQTRTELPMCVQMKCCEALQLKSATEKFLYHHPFARNGDSTDCADGGSRDVRCEHSIF